MGKMTTSFKPITFVNDIFNPHGCRASILEMMYDIKYGVYKEQVEKYRRTKKKQVKYNLPAYCLGLFRGELTNENLEEVGYIGYDIDDYSLDNCLSSIKAHKNVLMAYKSVSGTGFWIVCKSQIFESAYHYRYAWKIYRDKLSKELNIPVKYFDTTSDPRRMMFLSYDPDLHFVKYAEKLQFVEKPKTCKKDDAFKLKGFDLELAVEILSQLSFSYHDWFRLGAILTKFEDGEAAFVNISKGDNGYRDSIGYLKYKFKQLKDTIMYFNQASIISFMKEFDVWEEYKKKYRKKRNEQWHK